MNFISFVLFRQSIKSTVFWAQNNLKQLENPRFEAEFLLSEILQKSFTDIRIQENTLLTLREKTYFFRAVKKRKQRIPAAYILGYKNWNGFKIKVNEGILIPRDETEVLLELIKKEARDFTPSKILDIGTGSGCIGLSLHKLFPSSKIELLDVSNIALKMAKKNIKDIAQNVSLFSFGQSNLLDSLPPKQVYQIIVANLPYVPQKNNISPEVQKEPANAIFSGDDGLDLIRSLAIQIKNKNIFFKELWLEFLPESAPSIQEIFKEYNVTLKNDISGQPFFACIKPNQN